MALSLIVFGPPAATCAGRPLAFQTRKALALLVYLAVEGGSHSREKLIARLWPDSDEARGRASLRTTLTFLRSGLAPALEDGRVEVILADQDQLAFNPEAGVALDLDVVARAVQAARSAGPTEGKPRLLQAALAAYRGEFLEGFSVRDAPDFDDWAREQREAWHRRMELVFERLAQWQGEAGEWAAAVDTAERWVSHAPLNEAAHRRLMQAWMAAGNRAAALQAYEACRMMLEREFAAEPAPATLALYERIRTAPVNPPAGSDFATGTRGAALAQRVALASLPLMGRAAEHTRLVEHFQAARAGQPQAVSLEGEAGIGKTRLARDFLRWAESQGAVVAAGQAFETGGNLPFQPVVEAVRSAPWPANLSPVWLAELRRLLPELNERFPDLPAISPLEAGARTRLFEATARWGAALAAEAPVVLLIDDAQWADEDSLDLLHYLARRWASDGVPALLLVTLRGGAILGASPVAHWLNGLARNIPLARLSLGPLSAGDIQGLLRAVAGKAAAEAEAPRRLGQWLHGETGGQPLFVVETLKALQEQGLLPDQPDPGPGRLDLSPAVQALAEPDGLRGWLAPGVREVIRTRLGRLSPAAATLLASSAVLGQGLEFEVVCQVAGLDELEGLPALDELLAGGWLREADPAGSRKAGLRFAHDRLRDVIYTESGETRRRVLHRRALAALEARQPAAPAASLAYHAQQAGLNQAAFHYSLAAGDEALQVFAAREAIAHYERARELAGEALANEIPAGIWRSLYTQLGWAYQLADDLAGARSAYQALLAHAEAASDASGASAALSRLGLLAAQESVDLAHAERLLQAAVAAAEQSGDRLVLAETEWGLAQVAIYAFDAGQALQHGERALALAREIGEGGLQIEARCRNALAYARLAVGDGPGAEGEAAAGATLFARLGNRALEADCLGQLARTQRRTGQVSSAIATARRLLAVSREIGNQWGQMNAAMELALSLADAGDYEAALAAASEGQALAAGAAHWWQALLLAVTGAVQRASLNLAAAAAAHRQALDLANRQNLPKPFAAALAAEVCADAVEAGDWEAALLAARQAIDGPVVDLLPLGWERWPEAAALAHAGETTAAAAIVQRLAGLAGGNPRYGLLHCRALAAMAIADGHSAEAAAHLEAALRLAEAMDLPGEAWLISAHLAVQLEMLGRGEAAAEARERCLLGLKDLAQRFSAEAGRQAYLSAGHARLAALSA